MICRSTLIPEVCILEPEIIGDDRGFFFESYNQYKLNSLLGLDLIFVQDNHSHSRKGVLRGLHYQLPHTQAKLVRVIEGEVFDVAVDIRRDSLTFGHWIGEHLSAINKKQMWVPEGFAHGFYVCSEYAQVLYRTTDYYHPESERSILWNDPQINIEWPIAKDLIKGPVLSENDQQALLLAEAKKF